MTLNAVIALILCFFSPNSTDFQADITVVEDRPIMSVKYCLPVAVGPIPLFFRKLWRTLQRGISAIAEHLVTIHAFDRRTADRRH